MGKRSYFSYSLSAIIQPSARPAPSCPAEKQACEKQALPRPAKIDKTCGAKLNVNSKNKILYPLSLCPQISSQRRKRTETPALDPVFDLRGDRLPKYGCFFGKSPNGLDPPHPFLEITLRFFPKFTTKIYRFETNKICNLTLVFL